MDDEATRNVKSGEAGEPPTATEAYGGSGDEDPDSVKTRLLSEPVTRPSGPHDTIPHPSGSQALLGQDQDLQDTVVQPARSSGVSDQAAAQSGATPSSTGGSETGGTETPGGKTDPIVRQGRFGKYQISDKIGSGGFGKVYLGQDPVLGRAVAVKTCDSEDGSLRKRFLREAKISAGLQHPNIVTVYDFGYEGDIPFMVQEYLDGEDLTEKIRRKNLTVEERLTYLQRIAKGLAHAHEHGVLHRDIKPANIRVLEDGQVRILDFGIARLLDETTAFTTDGTTLGTVGYLAPEFLSSDEVDERSDIFSFGVLAYELMSYRRPFEGDTFVRISFRLLNEKHPSLSVRAPDCPPALVRLIDRCLEKKPKKRPASFQDIVVELTALLEEAQATSGEAVSGSTAVRSMSAGGLTGGEGRFRWGLVLAMGMVAAAVVGLLWLQPAAGPPSGETVADGNGATAPSQPIPGADASQLPEGQSQGTGAQETRSQEIRSQEIQPPASEPGASESSETAVSSPDPIPTPNPQPQESPGPTDRSLIERSDRDTRPVTDSKPAPESTGSSAPEIPSNSQLAPPPQPVAESAAPSVSEPADPEPSNSEPAAPEPSEPAPNAAAQPTEEPVVAEGGATGDRGAEPVTEITAPAVRILPELIEQVEPVYPMRARRRRMEATVVLGVRVDTDGSVIRTLLKSTTVRGMGFEAAAKGAARQSRFQAGTVDDRPTPMWTEMVFQFRHPGSPQP